MARELLIAALLVACKRAEETAPVTERAVQNGRPPLAQKAFYRVDLAEAPACKASAPLFFAISMRLSIPTNKRAPPEAETMMTPARCAVAFRSG